MSQIQQLLTAVNNLTERLSQIESNSKRIFELPQNITPNGLSKFAISRPEGIGETTEYMTLNKILEWCIEEIQNIENSTILVQMLPPELLSSPRRIKIPTLSGETEVPIVWKILGVQYSESEEQEIEIPDADEDNYRKDLILGTQNGDIIRFQGVESDEGVIEPIQPENTVLLTSIVVFGDSVYQEPTEPTLGSNYIPKASEGWFTYMLNSANPEAIPTLNAQFNINFLALANGHIIPGLNITSTASKIWNGGMIAIRNNSPFPITLKHLGSSGKIRFDFSNTKEDFVLTNDNGVKYFKLGVIPSTGNAIAYCLNDFVDGGSGLPPSETGKFLVGGATDWEKRGITVYDLIDSPPSSGVRVLAASFTSGIKTGYPVSSSPTSTSGSIVQWSSGGVLKGNDAVANNDLVPLGQLNTILENLELPADQVSYDNTASGLLAETVQEAVDELAGHVTELYETKEDRVSVVPITVNTTITAAHHGKILLITADVVVTFPTGLGAGFTGCAFRIATGGKMTPAFGSGVTGNNFFADYNPGESLYVFKESNSTNVFYAV